MKKDKSKSKSHETNIGKIIYGFLLFLPLIAIGVTCGYAIFNKNAYQSYYGETINEKIYVSIDNELEHNTKYNFISYVPTLNTSSIPIYVNGISNLIGVPTNNFFYTSKDNIESFSIYANTNNGQYSIRYKVVENENYYYYVFYNNNILSSLTFDFYSLNDIELNYIDLQNNIKEITYNNNSFISEVFYYSVDKVQQSPLFNWAQNSIVYTTLTATCTALSINNTFIPLLLAYWLIISIIYILYDITLVMLMIFHRKVHELQDSI